MRPSGTPAQLEQRRLQAALLFQQGLTPVDVAKKLHVQRRSVRRWRSAFLKQGPSALKAKPASGRPSRLTKQEKARLEHALLRGAFQAGFATDLWTCPRVAAVIRKLFRIDYNHRYLPRLLRSLGWSPQKPERLARERDERAIRRWVKVTWPDIKKKPKRSMPPSLS